VKRSSLLAHLRRHGCYLKREGRSHSLWINPKLVQSKRYLGTSKSQTISLEKSAVIFLFPTQAASKALSNNRINNDLRQRRFAPPAQARYAER